jgi:SPP1 family predicted phage head-tail adaptor
MTRRDRIGSRRHRATFSSYTEEQDYHGNPNYAAETFREDVPVEMLSTSGGERIRGRQVTAETTHVMYSDYYNLEGVTAQMQALVGGVLYHVVSVLDMDGDRREIRVELKREQ